MIFFRLTIYACSSFEGKNFRKRSASLLLEQEFIVQFFRKVRDLFGFVVEYPAFAPKHMLMHERIHYCPCQAREQAKAVGEPRRFLFSSKPGKGHPYKKIRFWLQNSFFPEFYFCMALAQLAALVFLAPSRSGQLCVSGDTGS